MPVSKGTKQGRLKKKDRKVREPKGSVSHKSGAKKEGTRVSTMSDVRGVGKEKGGSEAGRRNRLRDGT